MDRKRTVAVTERFDKDYYDRFYFDHRTAVTTQAEMDALLDRLAQP